MGDLSRVAYELIRLDEFGCLTSEPFEERSLFGLSGILGDDRNERESLRVSGIY